MIDVLKNHTPDIMGTQEGLKFQTMAIKDAFENWEESGLGVYHNILALNPRRPYEDMDGCSCRILYDASKFDLLDQGTFWQSDTLTAAIHRGVYSLPNTGYPAISLSLSVKWNCHFPIKRNLKFPTLGKKIKRVMFETTPFFSSSPDDTMLLRL
jgi:hypothetical protein